MLKPAIVLAALFMPIAAIADEGSIISLNLPRPTDDLFAIFSADKMIVDLKGDGRLILGDGYTPQEAALVTASKYSYVENGELCKAAKSGNEAYTPAFLSRGEDGHGPHWEIDVRPNGDVEYAGLSPSVEEYAYFRTLGELYACK
jgi:hypothetical protein